MSEKIRGIFLFFLLIAFSFSVSAQFDFNENCKNAYSAIINLKFDEGKKFIDNEKKNNADNYIVYYLENYIDFLTVIIGQEQKTFEVLESNKRLRINALQNADKNSPYYRYCLANVHLQWAFARLQFKEYFTAALEINKAYRLFNKNKSDYPDFMPGYVGLGLLHTIFGTVPDKYKWLINIVGFEGTIEQGISELQLVLEDARINNENEYLKAESLFFLSLIQLNLKSDKIEAMEILSDLDELQGDNPLKIFSKARILMRTAANDEAIELLISYQKSDECFPFYYLDFLTGMAKLHRLDKDAVKYFQKYIINFNGVNYVNDAFQKIAWHYLINGNKEKYFEYIKKVSDKGLVVDADKQALKESKTGIVPNVNLLKARLLFDGGYYEKAVKVLDELISNDLKNFKDTLEYKYRYA
ncbi:MAG: hypothetical protein K8R41_13050, partial [Bacteroidales bacterium]|nr:hypothetical protein [Bacteroidales bacterium]